MEDAEDSRRQTEGGGTPYRHQADSSLASPHDAFRASRRVWGKPSPLNLSYFGGGALMAAAGAREQSPLLLQSEPSEGARAALRSRNTKVYPGEIRIVAVAAAGSSGTRIQDVDPSDPDAVAGVAKANMMDGSADVRHTCLELLASQPAAIDAVGSLLLPCLKDSIWYVRRAAVQVVARYAELDENRRVSELVQVLAGDGAWEVRAAAIKALRMLDAGCLRRHAGAALAQAASDSEWEVRALAVGLLGTVLAAASPEEVGAPTVPIEQICEAAIAPCLQDPAAGVRLAAIQALGSLGSVAVTASEGRLRLIAETDATPEVCDAAYRALHVLGVSDAAS